MKKRTWTEEQERILEKCYSNRLPINDIATILNKTQSQITDKAARMGLTKKYIKSNNPKFKAIYQDYDWCYERYINRSMSHEEMAEEAGCSLRVMQKWCSEKHRLNNHTFKELKKLNDLQYQLILFGTLGDGHIDRREDQPMYIESHSIDEKDYIFWKYNILKDICNKEPVYYKEGYYNFGGDEEYLCKPYYRINTKIINQLKDIRSMSRLDKINKLNEFGFCLHTLDDGSRHNLWSVCLAEWTDAEVELYMNICKDRFGLYCTRLKDTRYVDFTAESSKKIDKMILKNIPNDLDIVHKKILDNSNIKEFRHHRNIITDNGIIGLGRFSKSKHIKYEILKDIYDTFCDEYVTEKDLLDKYYEKLEYDYEKI